MNNITIPLDVQEAIAKYNTASRANQLFYNDKGVNHMMVTLYPDFDRFKFVNICNQVSYDLIDWVCSLDGTVVVLPNGLSGVIEHKSTRTYEDRELRNSVSLRCNSEIDNSIATIAVWVNTGDRGTTHLYNLDRLQISNGTSEVIDSPFAMQA